VDAGVPALVFFAMLVVGMELTIDDFRRVARQPATVAAATAGRVPAQCIWTWHRCIATWRWSAS
jgi:hypothetical protein